MCNIPGLLSAKTFGPRAQIFITYCKIKQNIKILFEMMHEYGFTDQALCHMNKIERKHSFISLQDKYCKNLKLKSKAGESQPRAPGQNNDW
jgi:hypothetical protein